MRDRSRTPKKSFIKVFLWPFKSYIRIIIVVAVIGLFQYQSIQIDILAREIRTLELKRKELINEKAVLQVEIDRFTHINRIEKLAKEKGLISSGENMPRLVVKKFNQNDPETTQDLKLAGVR
jgi:cell division protein FtsL